MLNTHWDHVSQGAREFGSALIADRAPTLAADRPMIVLGDLNAGPDSAAVADLVDALGLVDTYRVANPEVEDNEGTFHGWTGDPGGTRIDHVLVDPSLGTPTEAEILRRSFDGYWPSDHFPVTAVLTEGELPDEVVP